MFTLESLFAKPGGDAADASSLYLGAFVAAQRLVALNVRATQALMENNLSAVHAVARAKDLESWQAAQDEAAQRLASQIVSYAGDFNEVVAENQRELARLLQVAAPDTEAAPPGTPPMAMSEVVKTMLEAALQSRNAMLEMAQRVSGAGDARTPER